MFSTSHRGDARLGYERANLRVFAVADVQLSRRRIHWRCDAQRYGHEGEATQGREATRHRELTVCSVHYHNCAGIRTRNGREFGASMLA
jgi:hypothetical protein